MSDLLFPTMTFYYSLSLFQPGELKYPPTHPILPPHSQNGNFTSRLVFINTSLFFLFGYCFSSLIHTFMSRHFNQDFVLSELFLLYETTSTLSSLLLIAALCPRLLSIVLAPLLSLFPL